MIAGQIVSILLAEADETPKEFLRRNHARLRSKRIPKMSEVRFELFRHDEDTDFRGNFTEQADIDWIKDQLERGNEWAWCRVEVTASWEADDGYTVEGHDYLGGCSYRDRRSFMEPGGYYDDMKQVAYDDLVRQLESHYETKTL